MMAKIKLAGGNNNTQLTRRLARLLPAFSKILSKSFGDRGFVKNKLAPAAKAVLA
jgi:hypothetical protein